MRSKVFFKVCLTSMLALFMSEVGGRAESFSCSFGQPACLDYGAVVCKSMAKCVSNDAVCFDSYTCGYGGFVCKTKLDDLVDEYDNLFKKAKAMEFDFVSAQGDLESVRRELASVQAELEDETRELASLKQCVKDAVALEDAQNC
jgi:hypothetical protein